jgi:hypothetical protein
MNFPFLKAKERLIRIMGTFDLATGHADTFDELLDSLESELRDVLGHYREALKQNQSEPVAYLTKRKLGGSEGLLRVDMVDRSAKNQETHYFIPLYTHPPQRTEPVCPECKAGVLYECVACSSNNYPPQRTWVGLTVEDAVLAEREACAKVCEETDDGTPYNLAEECARNIRARGQA